MRRQKTILSLLCMRLHHPVSHGGVHPVAWLGWPRQRRRTDGRTRWRACHAIPYVCVKGTPSSVSKRVRAAAVAVATAMCHFYSNLPLAARPVALLPRTRNAIDLLVRHGCLSLHLGGVLPPLAVAWWLMTLWPCRPGGCWCFRRIVNVLSDGRRGVRAVWGTPNICLRAWGGTARQYKLESKWEIGWH
jgi:hypothetical protein